MTAPLLTERERHTADMLAAAIKGWLADSGFVDTARAEGYRAGIEAAAKALSRPLTLSGSSDYLDGASDLQDLAITTIRALADAPAPDPVLAGVEHVRQHLRVDGNAARLIAWLDAEIAARKGG